MDNVMQAARIRHYLETGEADADPQGWPGANFLEQARNQHAALSTALIADSCAAQQIEPRLTPPVSTRIRDASHQAPIATPRGSVAGAGAQ